MARRKTKKTHATHAENWMIGSIILLLLLGTFVVVTMQDPERIDVTSADGLFHVEGTVLGEATASIQARDDIAQTIKGAYGTVYQVSVSEPGWFPSADVSYRVGEQLINQVSLYQYDADWLAWNEVDLLQTSHDTFYIEDQRLSENTLWVLRGAEDDQVLESAQKRLDELITAAVPNAVGYKAVVAHAAQDGEYVIVDEDFARGGCDGEFVTTSTTTMTSHEQEIEGGVERVLVRWYIGEGCLAKQKIK
jgi:hypothetical protein